MSYRQFSEVIRRSSHMAFAHEETRVCLRETQIDFWDGIEHTFLMPSITARVRTIIWDAVADYIQEQLLLHKGVRIPSLGSFELVPVQIQVGKESVTIQRPVFHLARNLAEVCKVHFPGIKELQPIKYVKVAKATFVSWRKVENCIQGTTSLLCLCLGKGKNIALVLKDIGVLLIEDLRVQMKYFYKFLERMSGKENLEKAISKVPQMLDMVVSPVVPVVSLTVSERIIIFPEFELEYVFKPPPRDPLKDVRKVRRRDQKKKKKEALPVLSQDKKDPMEMYELSSTTASSLTDEETTSVSEKEDIVEKIKAQVRAHLATLQTTSEKEAAKGKSTREGQRKAKKKSRAQAKSQRRRKGQRQKKVLPSISSEARMPEELSYAFITQPPGPEAAELLKSRPEIFWSVLKEPQRTILAGYMFEPSSLLPVVRKQSRTTQWQPLKTRSVVSKADWPWLE